jgi:hypothetical protein
MSTTIDEKVVKMRFDNQQFESNVQTSLNTLDRLKKSLDMEGAAKGLEQVNDAAKRCDMSKLSGALETVQARFSSLEVMAVTALANITNSAVNAGKRMLAAFTIDPIKSGFDEYELKMGSIQTIMASTGESLDVVNQKLDELNTYSDRTIYSFADMTENIGKFTNAGVNLDDAVAAIQGVANVAAVSGANANEASRAMYNFGQALSSGSVRLIDWKSIELANMATVEFKEQLIETAVELGTLVKVGDQYQSTTTDLNGKVSDLFTTTTMFNDSLSSQWMTTDVLTKTLGKYADETTDIGKKAFAAAQDVKTFSQLIDTLKESAQSGWAETWQLIVGDYEEAKKTLTEFNNFFSNIISASSEARNSLLSGALMSSWGQLKDTVKEAGFSVDDFRTALQETASETVTDFDKMVEEVGSFDDTLSKGWLTTDILVQTLDKLANQATGTTEGLAALSDEQLKNAGYTEEQVQAIRELEKQAKSATGPVSELVENMTRKSGRELLFESLLNICKALESYFSAVKEAWADIFLPATSEQLYGIIEGLHQFTQGLILSEGTMDKIKRTFKGVFAVLDIGVQAFTALFNGVKPLLSGLGTLASGFLSVTAAAGDWLVNLDGAIRKNDIFNKGVQKLTDFIRNAVTAITEFADAVREKLHLPTLAEAKESVQDFLNTIKEKIGAPGLELVQTLMEKISERLHAAGEALAEFKDGILSSFDNIDTAVAGSAFFQIMQTLFNGVKTLAGGAIDALSGGLSTLITAIGNADFSGVLDFINALSFGGIALAVKKFTEPLEAIGDIKDNVVGILNSVKGCFEAYQTQLQAGTLLKIAGAIAILTAAIVALSVVDSEKLNVALGAITMLFVELMASMAVFNTISGAAAKGLFKNAAAMTLMSTSILILSSAMKKLADLEWEDIAQGLVGIAGMAGVLVAASKLMSSSGTIQGATSLVVFAAAISILASACKKLSTLDWDALAKGLTGVGVLLAEVAVFLRIAKFESGSISTATGIVVLAAAINILAIACSSLGGLDIPTLVKGLAGVATLLAALGGFTKLVSGSTNMVGIGTGLVLVGASMKIFASAVSDLGGLDIPTLAKGLTSMAVALAEIAIAMKFMPDNLIGTGTGLVIVAAALQIVASVLSRMGGMSMEEIGKGLLTLGVSLTELTVALKLMQGTLSGSAALLVASTALLALAPALRLMGGMSVEQIAKSLITLAGAFTVIGVAGALLTPLTPTILALGAALALIGVGVAATGAGVALLATGITALALALAGGATAIVAGVTAIISGVAALIPAILTQVGEAIIAFCEVIAQGAPAIGEALKAVVLTLIDVLVECVPALAEGALALIDGVLAALVNHTPSIVDSIFQFLIAVLEGVAQNLPALIQAAVDVLMAFFSGIVDALSGMDTDVLLKGIVGVGLLAAMITALSAVAGLVPGAMVGIVGMGAVIAELALVLAAIGALAQIPGLNWLINEGGTLLESIGNAIGGFVGGIVGGLVSGVTGQFPEIGSDLSDFMTNVQPFVEGASKISPAMMDGVKALTEAVLLLTAADILDALTSWLTGGSSLASFGEDLVPFGESMLAFSQSIAGMDGNLVSNAAIAGKTLAEMAATLPNSGGVVGFFTGENDMDAFGEQLVSFGGAMMAFAGTVQGLDAEVVTNAATAGKAMAEMAATLPNSGGVAGFFAGENDMDAFGEQLIPFGRAIKAFSTEVAGLDVEAVQNSATAGQAMAELAKTLPNSGGAVAFFTGENNLDTFGTQLVSFGTSIKAYSLAVAGLDTEAVVNSATAGQALVVLADTIPNCGGLVAFFTGDNNIADFGDDLVLFGFDLAAYAAAIRSVEPDAVTASANAASALSSLASGLPDISLFDKWFGGEQTLADFGDDIAAFGEDMGYYYSQIAGADPAKLSGVIDQVWRLVELAEGTQSLDASGFYNFSSALNAMALAGLDSFTKAFANSSAQVNNAVSSMLDSMASAIQIRMPVTVSAMGTLSDGLVNAVRMKTPNMNQAAVSMIQGVVTTIQSRGETVKVTVNTLLIRTLAVINSRRGQFVAAGGNVTQGFADGIRANIQTAVSAAAELADAALAAAKTRLDINSPSGEFKLLGMYVDVGLANGIKENAYTATNAAVSMAAIVVQAFKDKLDIHSPSGVMRDEVGRYIVMGIAEGITNDMSAEEAAAKKAQNIVNAFKTELDKFDLDASTADLEYQLWEKLYGATATASEKEAMEMSVLANKLQLQSQKVSYAQAEYQTTLDQLGAASEDTQEAYNKLLQEQIELAELAEELNTAQSEATQRNREAFQKYADYLNENQEALLNFGFSLEEIKAAAQSSTGYDPNAMTQNMSVDVQKVVADAMSNVQVAYQTSAEGTFRTLVTQSTEIGTSMAAGIGTGLQNGAPQAVQAGATSMVSACADSITSQSQTWNQAGGVLVDSFIAGIQSNVEQAAQAVASLAESAYQAAINGIVTASETNASVLVVQYSEALRNQSDGWGEIGNALVEGVANGILANQGKVTNAAVSLVSAGANSIIGQKQLWVNAASVLVDGFIEGIRSNVERAAQEAAAMAMAAYSAAMSAIGGGAGGGVSISVGGGASAASSGGSVRRVMNMDDMVSQAKTGAAIATTAALSLSPMGTLAKAAGVAASAARKAVSTGSSKESSSGGTTVQNFTQNNYSPKSLDRTTLYRNTKNLFSQLKGG